MRRRFIALGALLCLGLSGRMSNGVAVREEAYRQNNVGLGLLEQYEYADAASAFRGALRTDPTLTIARVNLALALFNLPDLEAARKEASAAAEQLPDRPQPQYILGLIAKAQSRLDDAVAAFQRVLALDPADVGANVNLGQIHLQRQAYADAIVRFRAAFAAQPSSATAAYNLGLALTRAGEPAEGRKMLERFEELRRGGGALLGVSYPEQGRYAEGIDSVGGEPEIADAATPMVRFEDVTAAVIQGDERRAAKGDEADGRVSLSDLDGDGDLDIVEVGRQGQRLLRSAGGRFSDITKEMGLDPGAAALGAVVGDYDNDGWPDLLLLRDAGPRLYHNDQGRIFTDVTTLAGIAPGLHATSAAFADVDHDGDLDIFLAGSGDANRLLRNNGGGKFSDVTADAGLRGGRGNAIGVVPTDFDNGRDLDFFVASADAPPALFKSLHDGRFRDVAHEAGIGTVAEGRLACVASADVDKDGYPDFFLGRADGPDLLLLSDGGQRFTTRPSPAGSSGSSAALFLDYDNDGLLDLVGIARGRLRVLRNLGAGKWADVSEEAAPPSELSGASLAAGDVDGDGAVDLVLRLPSGALRLFKNHGGNRNRSFRVRLAGRASNKNGVGAKVDIRAGSLRQRLETSAATPAPAPADIVFGLGSHGAPDAVRVVWPSGIIQAETDEARVDMRTLRFEELDRKPS